jgi:hypothetical protein
MGREHAAQGPRCFATIAGNLERLVSGTDQSPFNGKPLSRLWSRVLNLESQPHASTASMVYT